MGMGLPASMYRINGQPVSNRPVRSFNSRPEQAAQHQNPTVLDFFLDTEAKFRANPRLEIVDDFADLPGGSAAGIVYQVGMVIGDFNTAVPQSFCPTCSRNHAEGTLPSRTTFGSTRA